MKPFDRRDDSLSTTGVENVSTAPEGTRFTTPIVEPPQIIEHPESLSVIHSGDVTLEVVASGPNLSYAWFKDGREITSDDYPNCSGIHSSCLQIKCFLPDYTGKYSCVVSNSAGNSVSKIAELTLGNNLLSITDFVNTILDVVGGNILSSLELSALRQYLRDKVATGFLNKIIDYGSRQQTLEVVQQELRRKGLDIYADELQKNLESGIAFTMNVIFLLHVCCSSLLEVQTISEALLAQAMEEGFVECTSAILLLVGVAGAGKSSFKRMLVDHDKGSLQTERNSTPLAEAAIRAVTTTVASVNSETVSWKHFDSESLQKLLADITYLKGPSKQILQASDTIRPSTTTSSDSSAGASVMQTIQTNSVNAGETDIVVLVTNHGEENTHEQVIPFLTEDSISDTRLLDADLRTKDAVVKILEYIRLRSPNVSLKKISNQMWIYIIDSGGQPQFQELLPLFIKSASAVAFFVKLNEALDHYPQVEYYSNGEQQGKAYQFSLTHRNVIENSLHTIRSRKDASGGQECPKLLFVGTFHDRLSECNEPVTDKDATIQEIIGHTECFRKNMISYVGDNPLFRVNAKDPEECDYKVANLFKKTVMDQFGSSTFRVPIRWFLFEQIIQELSVEKKTSVFSKNDCKQIASWIKMDEDNLEVALRHLVRHNVLSWFEHILPDVIFTSAQVILDKISEIVERSYILCNSSRLESASSEPFMYGMEGKWRDFRNYGYISDEILKEFPKHYNEVFTPTKLLEILVELLIVAKESDNKYFMPCILRPLPTEDLCNYRTGHEHAPPLLIYYQDQFFPTGVFSCMISHLRNKSQWRLLKQQHQPKCFYKNCVQFNQKRIQITLIYSQQFMEVHPKWMVSKSRLDCHKDCQWIRTSVENGLIEAANVQDYGHLSPKIGVFCPATHDPSLLSHVAGRREDEDCHYWECTRDESFSGEFTEQQLWWIQGLFKYIPYNSILIIMNIL